MTLSPEETPTPASESTEADNSTIPPPPKSEETESTSPKETETEETIPVKPTVDPEDLCPICSAVGAITCKSCKKTSYCTKSHQRLHWKDHRWECYPLIHNYDKILGSRLITTRNIKQGEIILREKPLVSGPKVFPKEQKNNGGAGGEKPRCLGCFEIVKSDYICPACKFPCCGPSCVEEGGEHFQRECKIFTSHKFILHLEEIERANFLYIYEAIIILRGVLLKEDQQQWQKILRLDEMWNSSEEEEKELPSLLNPEFSHFCHEFIMSFQLPDVTVEDIQIMLRVKEAGKAFEIYDDHHPPEIQHRDLCVRSGTYLYYTATQASQNCIPNCTWRILPSGEIYLRSLVPIQFGRTISLSHADVTEGTVGRQLQLASKIGRIVPDQNKDAVFMQACECERCSDSTELGSFYSAVKCTQCHHKKQEEKDENNILEEHENLNGWLLPVIHAGKWRWKCQLCGIILKTSELCPTSSIEVPVPICSEEIEKSPTHIQEIEQLQNKVRELEEIVHWSNFQVYKLEMRILSYLSELLKRNLWSSCGDKWVLMVEEFMNLSRKWLNLADTLWPGFTKQRGMILNYFQQALTIHLIIKISLRMRKDSNEEKKDETELDIGNSEMENDNLQRDFLQILNTRREVLQIFCCDSKGSFGQQIAQSVVNASPEIEVLKRYVFLKKN